MNSCIHAGLRWLAISGIQHESGGVSESFRADHRDYLPISTTATSVAAVGSNATTGVVTIVMKAIGSAVSAGQTIVYNGNCGVGGMSWAVTGTIASKFRPKT